MIDNLFNSGWHGVVMNRREFLSSATCLLGTGLLHAEERGLPAPAWRTAMGLNGFASSAKKYGKSYPIWEVLKFIQATGFQGVELVGGWPAGAYPNVKERDRCRALRDLYDRYQLQIFSIQGGAGGAFDPSEEKRMAWLQQFREQARLASVLGCDCIGLWPGGGLRGQSIDSAIGNLAQSLSEAARIGEQFGLVVAFEIEPPFVFNTEEHLRRILDAASGSPLKTIYDPSHFDLMNESSGRPHEMLARIGVDQIGYVHLTDCDGTLRDGGTSKHLPAGQGHVDLPASLKLLRQEGFSGWVMIDAWEIQDPYLAGRTGLATIKAAMR